MVMLDITFPVVELIDRLAIDRLKFEITKENKLELDYYELQAGKFDLLVIAKELNNLIAVHQEIWNLEYLLKTGCEDQLSLEEIGRRPISIRNANRKRIQLKNCIAEKLNDPIREIKKDHLSQ
jgi:hypothetical protein